MIQPREDRQYNRKNPDNTQDDVDRFSYPEGMANCPRPKHASHNGERLRFDQSFELLADLWTDEPNRPADHLT